MNLESFASIPPKKRAMTPPLHLYRSLSVDSGQKKYLNWRADRMRTYQIKPLAPAETDPQVIEELWNSVYSGSTVQDMSGRSSKLPIRGGKAASKATTESSDLTAPTSLTEASTRITSVSRARTKLTPGHRDFREDILQPRGIVIDVARPVDVWKHFSNTRLGEEVDRPSYYKSHVSEHSNVWIRSDEAFRKEIAMEYKCMLEAQEPEAEFACYALETFLRRDTRTLRNLYEENRCWITARKLELVSKPDKQKLWETPPPLNSNDRANLYDFDIRPDCAYWLSLQSFNADYTSLMRQWLYIINDQILSPYFFVEFKKADKAPEKAQNQVAVAAAMALYNRYKLRVDALEQHTKTLETLNPINIKAYGLTLVGKEFTVWCVSPNLTDGDKEWAGCTMTSVGYGDCRNPHDVLVLIDWINEIHRWGLKLHGESCQNDVKMCLKTGPAASRVSDINPEVE